MSDKSLDFSDVEVAFSGACNHYPATIGGTTHIREIGNFQMIAMDDSGLGLALNSYIIAPCAKCGCLYVTRVDSTPKRLVN